MTAPSAAARAVAPIERSFIVVANPWKCPGFPDAITPITAVPITAPNHPGWKSLSHVLPDADEGVWVASFRSSSGDDHMSLSNHVRHVGDEIHCVGFSWGTLSDQQRRVEQDPHDAKGSTVLPGSRSRSASSPRGGLREREVSSKVPDDVLLMD